MANHSAVVATGLLVLLVILVIASSDARARHGRPHLDKDGFGGSGLGHGRAPLGGGSHLEGSIYHFGFEPEQFSTREGLGGRAGGGHAGGSHAAGSHGGSGRSGGSRSSGSLSGRSGGGRSSGGLRGGGGRSGGRSGGGGRSSRRGEHRLWQGSRHRRPWAHGGYGGNPAWWYWWQASPVYAMGYPGYCDWCAHCDNLDPDETSQLCASCKLNCPYGLLRPYGL